MDVVGLFFGERGLALEGDMPDVTMMLELGVPRETDMALIGLGLSRATALAVSTFIPAEKLTAAECQAWFDTHDVEVLGLPAFAVREIQEVLHLRDEEDIEDTGGDGAAGVAGLIDERSKSHGFAASTATPAFIALSTDVRSRGCCRGCDPSTWVGR